MQHVSILINSRNFSEITVYTSKFKRLKMKRERYTFLNVYVRIARVEFDTFNLFLHIIPISYYLTKILCVRHHASTS